MVLGRLKKILAMALVGASSLFPLTSKAYQDRVVVQSQINDDSHFDEALLAHYSAATDGLDSDVIDIRYSPANPELTDYSPKTYSIIEATELSAVLNATNSVAPFNVKLGVDLIDGQSRSGSSRLEIKEYVSGSFNSFDPARHYVGTYNVSSNFTQAETPFSETKNLRDLCTASNQFFIWNGPNLDLPNTATNSQGVIDFGTFTLTCDWNKLVSSKSGNGSASFEGSQIFDYNSSTSVAFNADSGHHVAYYVLTTTDNTGRVSVVTNTLGQGFTSTNVPIDGIKGSNSIHFVADINKYIISPSTPENGTITPSSSIEVNHGNSTNFAVAADPHYHIFTITQNGSCVYSNPANLGITGTNIFFNNVTNNGSLGVLFSKDRYNLTVNSAHGNTWPGTTNAVPHNTTLEQKITNTPVLISSGLRAVASGFNLSGNSYYMPASSTNILLSLTNNATLTWVWATQALFNASSQNGTISGSTNGWYDSGNSAVVTNTPNPHYSHAGWYGSTHGCTINGNKITVPMDTPRSITASNSLNSYLVNVVATNKLGQSIGNPSPGTTSYPYGSTVTQSIDSVINDPSNPGKRYRVTGYNLE